jgi:fatty acid desaturase
MMATRLLRQATWSTRIGRDAMFIALAIAHGGVLLAWPSMPIIAIGLWWNANTISHNFIHRPFFRSKAANSLFSCCLTLLLGFPQCVWRSRHLAHHGMRTHHELNAADIAGALVLWGSLVLFAPQFTLFAYLPGFVAGLGLCYLQGYYEHARGTISHYGKLYNLLMFNDGYHIEHHLWPGVDWRELPCRRVGEATESRWPAMLRWLDCVNLCALERLVLVSPLLQRFVIRRHEQALRSLLSEVPEIGSKIRHAGIVGGGIFPRTAIILARIFPDARLVIIDMSSESIAISRRFIPSDIEFVGQRFDASASSPFDLLVIPLAFVGDRSLIYRKPPARLVLVHDWIWRRPGQSADTRSTVVSWLLLKRINLLKT